MASKRASTLLASVSLVCLVVMLLLTLTEFQRSDSSLRRITQPSSGKHDHGGSQHHPERVPSPDSQHDIGRHPDTSAHGDGSGLTADRFNEPPNAQAVPHYESSDTWRGDAYQPTFEQSKLRPQLPPLNRFESKGEFLKQPIVADYAKNAEKIFLMIKEGGSVAWERMPVHLFTTLTRVPNFALYSDAPGSIGGYELIDALANSTQETMDSDAFKLYRFQKYVHNIHGVYDYKEITLDGGWELDKFKNIPMLRHAWQVSPQSDWFVMMDGDSYFMLDNLMAYLDTLNPDQPLYLGSTALLGGLPFAHGGSGIVLSRKAVELSVGSHPEYVEEYERLTFSSCCGDAMLALMLKEKANVTVSGGYDYPGVAYQFQGNSWWDMELTTEKWCQRVITFHHVTPHDIELLWEFERLQGPNRGNITWGKIYEAFTAPYIDNRIDNWDNFASHEEYTANRDRESQTSSKKNDDDSEERPWESFEACQKKCESKHWCLSFRYLPAEEYCGLGKYAKLGKPVHEWFKDSHDRETKGCASGWMIDRLRNHRKQTTCDSLYNTNVTDVADGSDDDFVEGWYYRKSPLAKEAIKLRETFSD